MVKYIMQTRWICLLSLVCTYLFFAEYLPPFRHVQIPYDLETFHYPLADYAFQALSHGRFPEWDPTIYCGMPFAANTQGALFYPGTWLMFALNIGRTHLSYQSLEDFMILHVWLAFIFCYWWLRRRLLTFPSVCGAAVFAYSGYMMLQLNHLGVAAGYAWMPLGLMGVDEAAEQRRWVPLWKVVVASAMCFLAGYPPTWFVFAVCVVTYALLRGGALKIVAAIGVSMLVSMVQLLPSLEMNSLKEFEARYGDGFRNPEFFVSYLIPNYFDFGLGAQPVKAWGEYLYLGAPAFLGLLLLVFLRRRSSEWSAAPLVGVLGISAVLLTNPFGVVWGLVRHSALLSQVCRDWYFLAGISLAVAPLAAIGLDRFLGSEKPLPLVAALFRHSSKLKFHDASDSIRHAGGATEPRPKGAVFAYTALLLAWSAYQLFDWTNGGSAPGWSNAWQPAAQLALFSIGIFSLRTPNAVLITALLLSTGIDYKVNGTSKRFNATHSFTPWGTSAFPEMDASVYQQMLDHPQYRALVDVTGPFPQKLRHTGLTTPQGFDPFLTTQYKSLIQTIGHFRSNWDFDIDPSNEEALQLLGVRYIITAEPGPLYPKLSGNPRFRLLEPSTKFYKVFEFIGFRPVTPTVWQPERRQFTIHTNRNQPFCIPEQFVAGWTVKLDGAPVAIERWRGAFQCATVPQGEHRIEFAYKSVSLRIGGAVSICTVLGLIALLWISKSRALPAPPAQ